MRDQDVMTEIEKFICEGLRDADRQRDAVDLAIAYLGMSEWRIDAMCERKRELGSPRD